MGEKLTQILIFQINEKLYFVFILKRKFYNNISFLHRKQIFGGQKEVAQSFLFLQTVEFPGENFLLYNHNRFFMYFINVKSQFDFFYFSGI